MTRYVSSHTGRTMRTEPYEVAYGDEDDEDDDDDDDFDDEDLDGYDGLSDYDEDDDTTQSRSAGRHANAGGDDRASGLGEVRRQRSVSEGSGSLLEPGDDNRRDHHNQLERKRRASIKTSYNDLREAIPSLRGSKASRAVILQRAVEYIEELHRSNRDHTHCVETLRRQNDSLDSRVQEMQRFLQRLDGEEAAAAAAAAAASAASAASAPVHISGNNGILGASSCVSGGATLRLVSSNISTSGVAVSGSGTTHLPVYRLMPQESIGSDRSANNGVTHVLTSTSPRANVLGNTSMGHARTRISPALHTASSSSTFNGLNVLNTAVSLVASAHSAFSSTSSSSVGSNGDGTAPQSSSQRSSPGSYSSASSTPSSLGNSTLMRPTHSQAFEDLCEDGSVVNASDTIIIPGQRKTKTVSAHCSSTSSSSSSSPPASLPPPARLLSASISHPSSPPSIVLAVPVRHLPANSTPKDVELVSKRQRLS
ncbi:putative helix-loop-helix zipper protein [Fasciola hepatica]|uniref:Helix-loop-helix zipper protein n=1 Tax=Fasciola hepatica TaxID=6192 RepID=A0A4E0S2K4_FASHE|nr:putative helix-loop-helix zipper protein [Fasciola hepatica]